MNPTLKKFLPHIIAYVILLVLSFVRFAPIVFEGKTLQQSDNMQAVGMQGEMQKIYRETGEFPLWTNSMFAGMPGYQILYPHKGGIQYVSKAFLLGNHMAPPHTAILLMMAGFYLLLMVLGVDWRIGIVGAVGFGLAANHMGLAEAGHSTKIIASAYVAPILAGIILTFRGKYWLGGGLIALFTALELFANHVQVTYYFILTLLLFGIIYLVDAARNGTLKNFFIASGVAILAALVGLAANAGRMMTTQEYAEETIRGTSELTQKSNSSGSTAREGGGLSKDYAFSWSYGKLETFNLLIPNFMGGSSSESFASDPASATIGALRQVGNSDEAVQLSQQTLHYWGDQPFTGGPVYMGAIFVLLFFLGAFLVKKPLKWYLIAAVVLTVMLAWGRHFSGFNYFIFDHFPLYNKFRDVTTALGTANIFVVLLGVLGLQAFFDQKIDAGVRKGALLKAGAFAGGLLLVGFVLSFVMDFTKPGENFPAAVASAVAEDRAGLLRADALRSLMFMGLAFGILLFWMKKRFPGAWAVIGVGVLATIDIWGIGLRYINSDDYVNPLDKQRFTAPSAADEQIMKDPDPYYRVADFRRNPFSNAFTSYHHLSMGGYHAAKLMRYQEMIERYLGDPQTNQHIYGMFNAKYFITQNDQVIRNPEALGNAWFVKNILTAPNADAEIAALASLDPAESVVIQEKYLGDLQGFEPQFDSTATISLKSYHPDTLVYTYSANGDQLAVFSEMYYPPSKGWDMYIDGQKAPDFIKANFTLRAAKLPAGQHEVKMVFSPKTYYNGETISLIGSLIALALAAWGIFWFSKHYEWPEPANLPEGDLKTERKTIRKTEAKKKKK